MQLGVVFPQLEIGPDAIAIRDYAQAAESLGYDHILVYDHVLGAGKANRPNWSGAYSSDDSFHEPFVLFGYLAGLTERIELATGILVLPQRQTALVAKQAAQVDVMSGGRLRLGIGIGWNTVEYEALDEEFHNRGKRSEEQIDVMRALWTNETVTFDGRWHKITDAGINPMPVQRPIPIWFGGMDDRLIDRIGRMGDGWIIAGGSTEPTKRIIAALKRMHDSARNYGRDPSDIGLEKVVSVRQGGPDDWLQATNSWLEFGATHISVNTMKAGLSTPTEHIDAIRRFKEAYDAA